MRANEKRKYFVLPYMKGHLPPKSSVLANLLRFCSDGVERSGLFCAICRMLEKINAEQEVDIFNAVKYIRQSRPEFISTQVGGS